MKVLFVSSEKKNNEINPLIKAQGDSLNEAGSEVEYFLIRGKGVVGYLSQISVLRNQLLNNNYDIVHAHFSYSGFVAALAGSKRLIVSLMGSDVNASFYQRLVLYPFYRFFWKRVIVKSKEMKKRLGFKKVDVVPNGVNINEFRPIEKQSATKKLEWNSDELNILFVANPSRPEKNYALAKESVNSFQGETTKNLRLHALVNVQHELIPYYMNACDIVLLTSLWEGSPNVIKEAMACNKPIVCTKVGDVEMLLSDVNGGFMADHEAKDVKNKLVEAYQFVQSGKKVDTRDRIIDLNLDSSSIADKILNIYNGLL